MAAIAELQRGREAYERYAWREACDALTAADAAQPLGPEDLERLATAVYMLGREDDYLALLERAHTAHLDAGAPLRAVRCGFWVGAHYAQRGDMARAGGWLARVKRVLDKHEAEAVEHGYLLIPTVFEREARGELDLAARAAGEAVAIAERFGDADLLALAAHLQGHMLVLTGELEPGLALLDEAMVPGVAGELSPIVTGIVYCGVILACRYAHEVRRAREWTDVLSRWCERQPDLVAFTGRCLVHRAEILQLEGAWSGALEEAQRAQERCLQGRNEAAAGEASYRQGELYRLRGEHAAAESAYRDASRRGHEPQPGLALLRLAQGERAAALKLTRRALAETAPPGERLALLPAAVEVALAAGELDEARAAVLELDRLLDADAPAPLTATLAHARGAFALAAADPEAALPDLRRAGRLWQALDAPYEVARARELAGLACRALGDEEGAALELDAARAAYAQLRAAPDLARLDAGGSDDSGLTARELEVLQLVAAGRTNRAIAAELVLSVRTIDRHVSNIFAKLGVSSRAAATSYAHEHRLVRAPG